MSFLSQLFGRKSSKKKRFESEYELGKELGKGTFGRMKKSDSVAVVREGINKANQNKFAVKVLRREIINESTIQAEIQILKELHHPNIISLIGYYETPQEYYIVTDLARGSLMIELMKGGELFDQIIARGNYLEKDAAHILHQLFHAIAYLHSHHIVHRDLKPENLLFKTKDTDSAILLSDFGLSKFVADDNFLKTACGSPTYVSPEIINGIPHGKPVDVWSAGVIMYVMLCGCTPFYGESRGELFDQISKGIYDFDVPEWNDVSESAKDLIRQCLIVDPQKRLTAEQILNHSWLQTESKTNLLPAATKYFNARDRFKRAGNAVIGLQRLKKASGENLAPETHPTA